MPSLFPPSHALTISACDILSCGPRMTFQNTPLLMANESRYSSSRHPSIRDFSDTYHDIPPNLPNSSWAWTPASVDNHSDTQHSTSHSNSPSLAFNDIHADDEGSDGREQTSPPPSPTVKTELHEHLFVSQSLALPIEVPLRATQATKEMRSMMHSLRLNPFTAHRQDKNDLGSALTWCGEEAKPLEEEPLVFEWQIEGYQSGIEDEFELYVMPSDDEDLPSAAADSRPTRSAAFTSSVLPTSADSAESSEITSLKSEICHWDDPHQQIGGLRESVDSESADGRTSASWETADAKSQFRLSGAWFSKAEYEDSLGPRIGSNDHTSNPHTESYGRESSSLHFPRRSPGSECVSIKLHHSKWTPIQLSRIVLRCHSP